MAKTRLEMRNEVLYKLGDLSNDIWSTSEVDRYINEGQGILVSTTRLFWDRAYLNDTAGTALADLPTDYLETDRVTWNWTRIPMMTADELRRLNSLYATQQGPVRAYTLEEDGCLKLRKWLVPAATATPDQDTNNTRIEYYRRAVDLSSDASVLSVPDRCLKYIRHYAIYRCLERRGPGQIPKLAEHYRARFYEGINRLLARRNRVFSAEVSGTIGGGVAERSPISPPRLPWNFGRVVKYRRW